MKIGIIGAGNIGSAVALHFRKLGHAMLIANSRGPETLSQVDRETGATPADVLGAAKGLDLLVIAIARKNVPSLPKDSLSDLPSSSPIADTRNYYPLRDGGITEIYGGMVESEWTSGELGRSVIKALNNSMAKLRPDFPPQELLRVARLSAGLDLWNPRSWAALLHYPSSAMRSSGAAKQ